MKLDSILNAKNSKCFQYISGSNYPQWQFSVWDFRVESQFSDSRKKMIIISGGSRIFPGGAPTPKIAIIFHIFAENCMKMKEFGPPGGVRIPGAPPWIRQW